MSGTDRDDVTVSADGVTVQKTLNADQPDAATVVLNVRSARSQPVSVELAEALPTAVSRTDVGFHPNYGNEHWRMEDDRVVFERSFEPGEEFTTIYGIRDIDEPEEQLDDDPELAVVEADGTDVREPDEPAGESVADGADRAGEADGEGTAESDDGPEELKSVVSKADSQPVKDVIAGERDDLPGLSGGANGEGDVAESEGDVTGGDGEAGDGESGAEAEVGAADAGVGEGDTSEIGEADVQGAGPGASGTGEDSSAPADAGDGEVDERTDRDVASALAEQLRAGTVSESDRELLRAELGTAENSTEVRIQHLQSQVADLSAYTDALEAFIDEEGEAQQLLEDVESDVEAFDDRLSDLEQRLGDDLTDVGQEIERLDGRLSELEARVDDHGDRLADQDEEIEGVESRVDGVETEQDELASDVTAVRESIDELREFRERLTDVLSTLTGGIDADTDDGDETQN